MLSTRNLIEAIAAGDAVGIEGAFNSAMAEKIAVQLDDMRQAVAQNMFASQQGLEEAMTAKEHDSHSKNMAKELATKHKSDGVRYKKLEDDSGVHHSIQHKHDSDEPGYNAITIKHKGRDTSGTHRYDVHINDDNLSKTKHRNISSDEVHKVTKHYFTGKED
jgi:hypothetical protein